QRLGERENGTARLDEAVVTYREALKERRRERAPLEWAMTQHNLGAALKVLGQRGSDTARPDEAITAYREALKERTRERVPIQWAASIGNQGVVLMRLAERRSDAALAKQAVGQIEAAYSAMHEGGHGPFAAYYQDQLPAAHALLERLSKSRSP